MKKNIFLVAVKDPLNPRVVGSFSGHDPRLRNNLAAAAERLLPLYEVLDLTKLIDDFEIVTISRMLWNGRDMSEDPRVLENFLDTKLSAGRPKRSAG